MDVLADCPVPNVPAAHHVGVPRAVFGVAPLGFALAEQSASDNRYMDVSRQVDPDRALRQFHGLQRALAAEGIPAFSFTGDPQTPDAVFPNNVYATAPGRLLIGAMRHPIRQREAERQDIRRVLCAAFGYHEWPIVGAGVVAELTGSLVIDRARGLGWCGLSERCTVAGAHAMHAAFGLSMTRVFNLTEGEYHTNVVLSVLAGRAAVVCPDGIADREALAALRATYPRLIELDASERAGYAGNCIALAPDQLWMSTQAADALRPSSRVGLERAGFTLRAVALDEIEKAGGSLRCMIGECY